MFFDGNDQLIFEGDIVKVGCDVCYRGGVTMKAIFNEFGIPGFISLDGLSFKNIEQIATETGFKSVVVVGDVYEHKDIDEWRRKERNE